MRRYYVLTALVVAVLTAAAGCLAVTFSSRARTVNGVAVGEVTADGSVPIQVRVPGAGLSVGERAAIIAQRLNSIPNLKPADITAGRVRGEWAVLARGHLIATAEPAAAAQAGTSARGLALSWRNQLRAALVPGGTVSPPPVGGGPAFVQTAQKVVPILSVGTGLRVGAALVAGSSDQVAKVKAVAQVEGEFGRTARIRALVPVSTEDVIRNIRRVPGTAVIAVGDIRL